MKAKLVIITILLMLVIGSFSASAVKMKKENESVIESTDTETIEVYVGSITIDCDYDDDLAVEIDCPQGPYEEIYPTGDEEVTFKFYLEWEILNPKIIKEEEYYFELLMRNGNSNSDPEICTNSFTHEGTLTDDSGTLYSDEITLNRLDFDKEDFWNRPETKDFRAELRGIYYQSGYTIDDDDLFCVTDVDMGNEPPTAPTLTSEDIGEGDTGSLDQTYTFTASGSTDPDGDRIDRYSFDFHDGTVDDVNYGSGTASASHKWEYTDSDGTVEISVYAKDRFNAPSDGTDWIITLPRSRDSSKLFYIQMFEKCPMLVHLLEQVINSKLLYL